MSKKEINIVFIDKDIEFITPLYITVLEWKDIEFSAEIITEKDILLKRGFRDENEIIVISEAFVSEINISALPSKTIIITDKNQGNSIHSYTNEINSKYKLFRYSSKKVFENIITEIVGEIKLSRRKRDTKVISVSSFAGGVGKTTLALSIATRLNEMGLETLYFDTQWLSNFDFMISQTQETQVNPAVSIFGSKNAEISDLLSVIRTSGKLNYFPAILKGLLAYNKSPEEMFDLVEVIKHSNKYRYIIVDSDHLLNSEKIKMINNSDDLVFVINDRIEQIYLLNRFMEVIDLKNAKLNFICNKSANRKTKSVWDDNGKEIRFTSVVPKIEGDYKEVLTTMASLDEIQELCYLLM